MSMGNAAVYLTVLGTFALIACVFVPTLPAFVALASSFYGLVRVYQEEA